MECRVVRGDLNRQVFKRFQFFGAIDFYRVEVRVLLEEDVADRSVQRLAVVLTKVVITRIVIHVPTQSFGFLVQVKYRRGGVQ